MRKLTWVLLGIFAAIAGGALAIDSGGFPSRPQFLSALINNNGTTTTTACGGAYTLCLGANSGGTTPNGVRIVAGSSSANNALVVDNGAANSHFFIIRGDGAITAPAATSVPWANLPISCTTACNATGLAIGQTATIVKGTTTNRTSSTTLTSDPDLQFTSLPAGTYIINLFIASGSAAGGANGLKWQLNSIMSACNGFGDGVVNSALYNLNSLGCGVAVQSPISAQDNWGFTGTFITASSSTQALNWAQNVSSASTTSVFAGSSFTITRVN